MWLDAGENILLIMAEQKNESNDQDLENNLIYKDFFKAFNGGDPSARDKIQASPLGWAIFKNLETIVHILLSHPMTIAEYKNHKNNDEIKTFQNIYGLTIMHSCAQCENEKILKLILDFGIFYFLLDVRDNNGKLPEDLTDNILIKNIFNKYKAKIKAKQKDIKECLVCVDKPKTHAFVPCGHKCVCEICAQKIVQDTICNKNI
eukprot:298980_1